MKKSLRHGRWEKPVLFLLENDMEKSEKNKAKDRDRTEGNEWVHIPATFSRRTTGSDVTFTGKYVPKKTGDRK